MLNFLKTLHLQTQGLDAKVLESERISAEIIEPVTNLEDSTEFHSQLFVTFNIMADIHNLQVTKNFSFIKKFISLIECARSLYSSKVAR